MRILVLSPHRDDAAFSCGLALRAWLASGATVTMVNICTRSSYAPYRAIEDARHSDVIVTNIRHEEDMVFAERLLASSAAPASALTLLDLAWKDAPLRWKIEDERVLTPTAIPAEEIESLSRQFQALVPVDLILAPLSLGGHVDHRLVHAAALRSFPTEKLIFYEDLPYACRLTQAERALADRETVHLSDAILLPQISALGLKQEFALCYSSQIAAEVAQEMESYAALLGGRERYYATPEAIDRTQAQLRMDGVA